eukprot:TRINITY_DN3693_c0_g1_i1.p1 TRINITY_DN3693_c0_g1~~TRINITY_DN3693_c0_g1_i1.p1  ORF type:complete len:401 (+),score=100.34 TRINITY_DN3693_c0_g1_i1:58-1260(+)
MAEAAAKAAATEAAIPLSQALKHAARNAAGVAALYGISVLLQKRRAGRKSESSAKRSEKVPVPASWGPRPDAQTEAIRTALGAVACSLTYYAVRRKLSGSAAAVASFVPLRILLGHAESKQYRLAYSTLVSAVAAPVLIELVPVLQKNPLLVMSLATAQLLTAWIASDDHLPPSYIRFLNAQSRMPPGSLQEMRRCTAFSPPVPSRELDYRTVWPKARWANVSKSFEATDDLSVKLPDPVRRTGTEKAAADYLSQHIPQVSLPFYTRLYAVQLIVALLRKRGKVSEQVVKHVVGCIRSSLFLSSYVTWTWGLPLWLGTVIPERCLNPISLWCIFLTPGALLAIERPAQRNAISAYCAPFGLFPLLKGIPHGFDLAAVLALLLVGSGKASKPFMLKVLWPQ